MAKPEPIWTVPTRVTIAGGQCVSRAARNIRRSAQRAVDASREHGRCWLLDEQGGA